MLVWPLIRDWRKSRFRMNIPDHFPESLETVFWVRKYSNSLMRIRVLFDHGILDGKIRIRDPVKTFRIPNTAANVLDFYFKKEKLSVQRHWCWSFYHEANRMNTIYTCSLLNMWTHNSHPTAFTKQYPPEILSHFREIMYLFKNVNPKLWPAVILPPCSRR